MIIGAVRPVLSHAALAKSAPPHLHQELRLMAVSSSSLSLGDGAKKALQHLSTKIWARLC